MSFTYRPPTADEVKSLMAGMGMSTVGASGLIGYADRSIRSYVSGERQMPFAVLYTLVHRARGIAVSPGRWREECDHLMMRIAGDNE